MESSDSPLRLLVKSYANGLLERKQYLEIRGQLLRKLSEQGSITHAEVKNFIKIYQDTSQSTATRSYTTTEWIIVALGLIAAASLAMILFE
jgi:hypothetical protein